LDHRLKLARRAGQRQPARLGDAEVAEGDGACAGGDPRHLVDDAGGELRQARERHADVELGRRVRIEFEFRSKSFHDHGHDPAGCDLVVCWKHDWPGAYEALGHRRRGRIADGTHVIRACCSRDLGRRCSSSFAGVSRASAAAPAHRAEREPLLLACQAMRADRGALV
jgi:hypothetical protein